MSESHTRTRDAAGDPDPSTAGRGVREAFVGFDESAFEVVGTADLLSVCRDGGLRHLELLDCRETGAVVQVEVERRLDGGRLAQLDPVESHDHVTASEHAHLYVVEVAAPTFPPSMAERAGDLLAADADLTGHGITMSLVGSRTAIADLVEEYAAVGLSPDLLKLGPFEGRDDPLDALTDRQREVLRTALEMGYFEVPRGARTEDLATELGIDVSTVAEHLQRAERNLLTEQVPGW